MNGQAGIGATLRATLVVVVLAIGGFTTFATFVAFFGATWWGFDLLANYRWQLFWILLVCAVVYALAAKGWATIVFIVAALVNAVLLAPLWLGSQPQATGEDGIRVVSATIYGGTSSNDETLGWLLDSNADVLIVSGSTADRLAPLVDEDENSYELLARPQSDDRIGVVILGREAYAVRTVESPEFGQLVHSVTVPSGDGTMEIVTTWGQNATDSQEAAALTDRIDTVIDVVNGTSGPVAVIGDLGATRFSHSIRSLMSETALRDASEGSGYLAAYPVWNFPLIGPWMGIPLDLALMSDGITPLELELGPDIGTNYKPLIVVVGPSVAG